VAMGLGWAVFIGQNNQPVSSCWLEELIDAVVGHIKLSHWLTWHLGVCLKLIEGL